jgi:MFS family permease
MRLVYVLAGIGISVWALTIPLAKIRYHLDDGTLGLILFASGIGGVAAMPPAGAVVARYGARRVTMLAGAGVALLLPLLAALPNAASFTVLVFVYGTLFGTLDVAMNAAGAAVQTAAGRHLMSGFHACYSLGTLAVALVDALLLRLNVSFVLCSLLAGGAALALLPQTRHLPAASSASVSFALPSRATVLLGACCFVCFFAEGAATDWSAVLLRFSRGMSLANATLGYAAFAVAVAAVRLLGDSVTARLGPARVMRLGSAAAAAGLALVAGVNNGWADVAGFFLTGLGLGNTVPLLLSAAARLPGQPGPQAGAAILAMGYAGFLAGPLLMGGLADRLSLAFAMGVVGVLMAALIPAARAAG